MEVPYIRLNNEKSLYTWAGIFLVLLTTALTGVFSKFDLKEAIIAMPGLVNFIMTDFLPPAYSEIGNIASPLLDTMYMAIISTLSATVCSVVLAVMCAAPTTPHPSIKTAIRAFVSLLRNIPALAWTLILVPAFGIGKFVGLLALFIGSVGTLTRYFAESIEEINQGGIEAIRSVGGSYWQTLKCGVFPQCYPGMVSWTLYNLELNIRASTIIGMVGGGGIGMYIQSKIKLFRYDYAMMAILLVAVSVLVLEFASKKIRSRLI